MVPISHLGGPPSCLREIDDVSSTPLRTALTAAAKLEPTWAWMYLGGRFIELLQVPHTLLVQKWRQFHNYSLDTNRLEWNLQDRTYHGPMSGKISYGPTKKKFSNDGPDGWRHYWRNLRKEPREFFSRNFAGGSVMVWGAFSVFGTATLAFTSSRMKSKDYIQVLQTHLLRYIRRFPSVKLTFQQDGASIHASGETRAWLQGQNLDVLPWAARSPDLSPIENLWGIMCRQVYEGCRQYNTVDELKSAILDVWSRIKPEIIRNLACHGAWLMFLRNK